MDKGNELLLHGMFAMLGGIVRELLKKKPTLKLVDFICGGVVGMFAGMVVYFFGQEYHWSENLIAAMCGMAGFLGPRALEELIPIFKRYNNGESKKD